MDDDLSSDVLRASAMLKALSDPVRLRILLLLEQRHCFVHELGQTLGIEQSALSHQLAILRRHRLVKASRQGKAKLYEPDDLHIYTLLRQIMEHAAEVEKQEGFAKEEDSTR